MIKSSILLSAFLASAVIFSAPSESTQFVYDAHGKRDPFIPLVGQDRQSAMSSLSEVASVEDLKLEGIAADASGKSIAIINGEMVKEGYKAGEIEIKTIAKRSVSLLIGSTEYTLNLAEEGGKNE